MWKEVARLPKPGYATQQASATEMQPNPLCVKPLTKNKKVNNRLDRTVTRPWVGDPPPVLHEASWIGTPLQADETLDAYQSTTKCVKNFALCFVQCFLCLLCDTGGSDANDLCSKQSAPPCRSAAPTFPDQLSPWANID